jgi:hypothetical protein
VTATGAFRRSTQPLLTELDAARCLIYQHQPQRRHNLVYSTSLFHSCSSLARVNHRHLGQP